MFSQVISLVVATSVAVTVEKKHDKRNLDGLGYGLQQEHLQEHVYGPPVHAPPVYEVPAPDLAPHPIHPVPEPQPPITIGHPVG